MKSGEETNKKSVSVKIREVKAAGQRLGSRGARDWPRRCPEAAEAHELPTKPRHLPVPAGAAAAMIS